MSGAKRTEGYRRWREGPDRQRRLKRKRDTTKFLKVSLIGTAQLFADDCDCVSALSLHFFFSRF